MAETAPFDPGLGKLSLDLYSDVYVVESDMANMPQLSRKIRYFRIAYMRIVKAMLNNLAFYNGCLAWGYYLKNACGDAVLSSNPFISLSEEQKSEYSPCEIVDFFIEYLPKFHSNLKYYNVKDNSLPSNTEKILSTYREFVALNEGFINTHKASDVLLPETLSFIASCEDIKNAVDTAIQNKDLLSLIELK